MLDLHTEELAAKLALPDFDLLLVGDGSGSFVHTPCGWFVTLYERKSGRVREHFGGTNGGTNNYAELMPYMHALWAYHAEHGKEARVRNVVIVSDSEVTVRCGNRLYERKANLALWAGMDWFESVGYRLHWHHVPRNSNSLSSLADKMAGQIRQLLSTSDGNSPCSTATCLSRNSASPMSSSS